MKIIPKFLFLGSIILIVLFIIFVSIDYSNYNNLFNSAPFTAYVLIRSFEFILPSIILFTLGIVLKNKYKK